MALKIDKVLEQQKRNTANGINPTVQIDLETSSWSTKGQGTTPLDDFISDTAMSIANSLESKEDDVFNNEFDFWKAFI
jgi:hypothetical protein